MRKVVIILVVAMVIAGMFLSPLFIKKEHSISFSIPPEKILIVNSPPEIESAESVEVKDFDLPFEKLLIWNTGSKLFLYGCRTETEGVISTNQINNKSVTKWYQTEIPTGLFYQIENTQIYSPHQILFDIGGNVGTTLFWALMSLGIGLILIFSIGIWEFSHIQQATT